MVDFLLVATRSAKKDVVEIYPKFIIKKSSDLMIRGGDFYAIWMEERGLWSTDEQDALRLIDKELDIFYEENKEKFNCTVKVKHMWDAESGMIDVWHKYCQKQMRDSFVTLDETLIFSNTTTKKEDYASKKLPYPLEAGSHEAFDELLSVLYSEEERRKIEWAIGAIVSGDSKHIQKFMVLYGAAGTGKSTILNIIQQLFEGYYSVFDAKSLGSANNAFALESFKSNPLVAIQHDGDLSHIEDNTRLNSLVSHEMMTVNEKFRSQYASRFKCFLFMGTNKPVRITDAKSGLIRRLIDVSPTGNKLSQSRYKTLTNRISFELGAIAEHCLTVYRADPGRYDTYIPLNMLGASNDFYNFVTDSYVIFCDDDKVTLKGAWKMYTDYCTEAKVPYPYSQRMFKEELRNYFADFKDRATLDDGTRVRNLYSGFLKDKFQQAEPPKETPAESWIVLKEQPSLLDEDLKDRPAQYASDAGTPLTAWSKVTSALRDIDTTRLHYVQVPPSHIVIDFDIPDEQGNKCFERNLEAASKWPKTYAELSKSGAGIHLHYIYTGDPNGLSRVFGDHIEIKVFNGNASLRRKLTRCNDIPIATISTGLPLKGAKMVNFEGLKNEKTIRTLLKKNLNKEIHAATKPSVDFIYDILEEAYASGMQYDVSDMKKAVISFAAGSTHQSQYCLKKAAAMHFCSENLIDHSGDVRDIPDAPIVFYDVEVFPNLFLVVYKQQGEGHEFVRMFIPDGEDIRRILQFRLIGFNCRRYDNHMLYARCQDASLSEIYNLSQRIVSGDKEALKENGYAYDISYTDVYDFCSKKQSLKKWEIELGIHHQELGLPWDKPVPKELWDKVAEYCEYDVAATEAVFDARKADFVARTILAAIAGSTVNTPTNTLAARIIFGKVKYPQSEFNYRDLSGGIKNRSLDFVEGGNDIPRNEKGQPIFPGYKYENGVSTYRGEEVGEGGNVYAEPGIYINVALLDIASMHPSSIIAEELFGKIYTARFKQIVDARLAVKHEEWETARTILDGKLAPYVDDILAGKLNKDDLAYALKIVINSVYGLTAANFPNPFRDERNRDNIVAKRGALFMVDLKHAVQEKGFTVAHIKTDSIKIPNATPEIIQFVMDFGKKYGYSFEHEATYEKMCLVNDAVYIAKYKGGKHDGEWTATGTQFQVPYVFKTLFSKEPIEFSDMCETKSVSTALYLDMNEGLPDVSELEKELEKHEKVLRQNGFDISESGLLDEQTMSLMDDDLKQKVQKSIDLRKEIEKGHNYVFVGKVGQFTPVKKAGGILLRETVDKKTGATGYAAATGSKGYRWLESETAKNLGEAVEIDRSYYQRLVDDAVAAISKYGDVEWFCSDDRNESDYIPPWEGPDEPWANTSLN